MVTLRKIAAHRASTYASYLTEPDATEEATGPDGDALATPGWWLGKLADEWGIARMAVDHTALLAILDGRDPRTGERIVRVWPNRARVAGHDLVFSAPSSVTAAWALAGEELRVAIQRAQDAAVGEAFGYIEREFALVRRRQDGAIISEPVAALLGAAFSHHISRQTATQARAGVPPDPQLHTHVLLPGMARRQDGAFVAVDSLELHRRRAEAGNVYRDALAAGLEGLGFPVKRATGNGDRYFELVGVPAELRQTWSSRSQEIVGAAIGRRQEFRAARGRDPTLTEEREWAAKSRTSKAGFQRGDLFTFWRDTAAHLGVTPATVEALGQQGEPARAVAQGAILADNRRGLVKSEALRHPGSPGKSGGWAATQPEAPSGVEEAVAVHFRHRRQPVLIATGDRLLEVVTSHRRRIMAGCRLVLAAWVHPRREAGGEPVTSHSYRQSEYQHVTLVQQPGIAPRPESVEMAAVRP